MCRSEEMEKDLCFLQARLQSALDDQHAFLEAKSHVKWAKDGDRNSKLFHVADRVRCALNNFKVTLEDETVSDDKYEIGHQAVSFFQNLLGGFYRPPDNGYFNNISPVVSEEENVVLGRPPDDVEIWDAV